MGLISLYLDEDTIKAGLVKALRNANLDVITVADIGKLGDPDESQLMWATHEKRVIYSFNIKDFCLLHRNFIIESRCHAGIIVVAQQRYSIGEQLRGLLRLIATKSSEDMINQLVFLNHYVEENL